MPLVVGREEEHPLVRTFLYGPEEFRERRFDFEGAEGGMPPEAGEAGRAAARSAGQVLWIEVGGLNGPLLVRLGRELGLHPLVVEDLLNTTQRPKAEDYGEYMLVVVKSFALREEETVPEQVGIVLGDGWVLSVQERAGNPAEEIVEYLRAGRGRLRHMGADTLAYALIDACVDGLFDLLERLGERIEDVEDRLVTKPNRSALAEVHHLRRETVEFRRHLWPMREAVAMLERGESALVSPETRVYLRDAYDHAIQAIDLAETCRDTLSGVLDLYLSSASWKLNEAMMELTVIATIFMPLTFIAGIYGMNFRDMPELSWRWGYPTCWALMIGIAAWLVLRFRKKGWLGKRNDFRPRRRRGLGIPSSDADEEGDPATAKKGSDPEGSDGDAREA